MRQIICAVFLLVSILLMSSANAEASLIAYYPFEGNANDASGNGYNGTVSGATQTSSGHSGSAYNFDATNDYISLPLDINPSAYATLTMGAWVKPSTGTPIQQVISHDNGGYDRSLNIDSRGGGTGWSAFSGTGGVLGYQGVALNQWAFIAAVYDQSAGKVSLYVDGNLYSENGSLDSGWTSTFIGKNPTFGEYFGGTIDDVFFYNSTLTKSELDSIRANGIGGSPVPEPATMVLFGIGSAAMAFARRKKKLA